MNRDAKLSIIIPIYNGENYIANTINSVLNSSYQNLEILLIDDGSTDHSLEICQKRAIKDSRIKVYHKENEGIAHTRNYGLKHATGDYIGFCDQDDEISSDMYLKMMQRIFTDNSQAAICGCYRKKKDGRKVAFEKYTDALYNKKLIHDKLLFPMLFKGFDLYENKEISIYTAIWKCIISRQLIIEKAMSFQGFVNYEDDFIMLLQLFLHAENISTLSDILYYWNTNIYSEMHRCIKTYINDLTTRQKKLMNFVVDELKQHNISNEIIDQYIYVQHCRNALLQLDNFAAMKGIKNPHSIKKLGNCQSILYIQSTQNRIKPSKGFVRNSVIIPLLGKKHIVTAIFLNWLIDILRFFVEKHHITEKLERKMKE